MQTERLAVFALASQVASGQAVRSEPARRNSWDIIALGSTDNGGYASAASVEQVHTLSPDLVNIKTLTKSRDGNRVFGAALPGLLVVKASSEAVSKYAAMRDSVFRTALQARISDTVCAGILVLFASAMF